MGKQTKKGRSTKGPKHVQVIHFMIDSAAWQDMGCTARVLFIELQRRYSGFNNGDICLSCREAAERLNVSKDTAARAFWELTDHDFIKVSTPASFSQKVGRLATRWTLTNQRMASHGPTHEWKDWKPRNLNHGLTRGTQQQLASHQRDTNPSVTALRLTRGTLQPKKADLASHQRDSLYTSTKGTGKKRDERMAAESEIDADGSNDNRAIFAPPVVNQRSK